MQDRFKFRVWNKEQNRFHHSFCCDITASGTLVISQGIEGKKYIVDDDNYVVQQCTGLKDKNGKLIYEGDIIQIPDDYDTYGMFACEKREIYFNEGGFRLKPKWDKNSRGNWLEDTKDFEVIGNIYENPKLLEAE